MAEANSTTCDRTNHTNHETNSIPAPCASQEPLEPIAYLIVVNGRLEWVLDGHDVAISDHGQKCLTDTQGGNSDA
jgi:hypothetical protein